MSTQIVFGITGTLGAGKGTAATYLIGHGYEHFSCRKFLLEEIVRRGMTQDRDSLNIVSNDLRKEYGPQYVAFSVYEEACKIAAGNFIVESIHNPAEILAIRAAAKIAGQRFILLGIDADQKTRYSRVPGRGSVTDNVTYEKFQEQEAREMSSTDLNKQNLFACLKMADKVIDNSTKLEDYLGRLERYYLSLHLGFVEA